MLVIGVNGSFIGGGIEDVSLTFSTSFHAYLCFVSIKQYR